MVANGTFKRLSDARRPDSFLARSGPRRRPRSGGSAPSNRFGLGANDAASIFVRGDPVIVNNQFRHNNRTALNLAASSNPAVNINVNALNSNILADYGRAGDRPG